MSAKIAICIPTYNRSAMLDYLLKDFTRQALDIDASLFSIIVFDNASTDDTQSIISRYSGKIDLFTFRQKSNVGVYNNILSLYDKSEAEYSVYCADDDKLDLRIVALLVQEMEEKKNIGAIYCPWMIENGSNGWRSLSYFNTINNTMFKKGDLKTALMTIIENGLFPEIAVYRTSAVKKLPPQSNVAFWFFLVFTQILLKWDILIKDKSHAYYTAYLTHPAGSRAQNQVGNMEVATSWDMYRGGLDVFIRSAINKIGISREEMVKLIDSQNRFVASRQIVAMRSQCKMGNYIDAYWLAHRIDLYLTSQLTQETARALSVAASIEYCYNMKFSSSAPRQATLVGPFPREFVSLTREHGTPWFIPVEEAHASTPRIAWDAAGRSSPTDVIAEPYMSAITV